jgi:hypothetical protein
MAKYAVIAGKHHVKQEDGTVKVYGPGSHIELDPDWAKDFPSKFRPLVQEAPKATAEPEVRGAGGATPELESAPPPAAPKPAVQPVKK